jgi:hypothetical protein
MVVVFWQVKARWQTMSDYISKRKLLEELAKYKFGAISNDTERDFIKETMLLIVGEQPTISETEIIRKAFERVVKKLEANAQKMSEAKAIRPYAKHSPADHRYYKAISVKKATKIIKEECGISE